MNTPTPQCCSDKRKIAQAGQVAGLLRSVGEENRLKILCLLGQGARCVCEIWQDLGLPQNLVSHHLKVLRAAGLVQSRKEGISVIYSLEQKGMDRLSSGFKYLQKLYGK